MSKIATLGTWDPTDRRIIFLASNPSTMHEGRLPHSHRYFLVAVNDLWGDKAVEDLEALIDAGGRVLIDSGVFWLTNRHKRAHDISMDEALALAPDQIEGFDKLWSRYLEVIRRIGDKAWGYMELDQGGKDNKRITRAKLNDLGVHPIPVWHPINDGADYFDELAETHDRMCLGNIVQADNHTRLRLLHTLWEKHRKYPDLWVHVLGMNPSEWFHCLSIDSADASTWVAPVRWGRFPHSAFLTPIVEDSNYEYIYAYNMDKHHDPSNPGHERALQMAAISLNHTQRSWRHWQDDVQAEFEVPAYPDPGWSQ